MKKTCSLRIAALCGLLAVSSPSFADDWTPQLRVTIVEPLVNWQGGMVRVVVDVAVATPNCGTTTVLDFLFTSGTQETRSALLAGLYTAVAADKRVQFYLSSTVCSPVGAPVITGMNVVN